MKTVLIADDEPITRMDLADMLLELGFSVIGEAADGFDAVELCRAHRPDVVLMDVKMPIFDGLAASETIIEEDLAGCVVLLTAFGDKEIIERAAAAGVTGYLVKPIEQKSLLPTIEVAAAQSERLRSVRREADTARQKLKDDRQIHKAQQYLARQQHCTEEEAYRRMRKAAMDKRITVAALAESLLRQAARQDDVAAVKQILMARKGLSDEKAYQYILSFARGQHCTTDEAAAILKERLKGESVPC